jgi:hypothetical protein
VDVFDARRLHPSGLAPALNFVALVRLAERMRPSEVVVFLGHLGEPPVNA